MNTQIRKSEFLPNKKIDAEKIMKQTLDRYEFQAKNEALRRQFLLRQKVNNNIAHYDRINAYIDQNITPSLKERYFTDMYGRSFGKKAIDRDLFKLYFLNNNRINLI